MDKIETVSDFKIVASYNIVPILYAGIDSSVEYVLVMCALVNIFFMINEKRWVKYEQFRLIVG